MAYDVGYQKKQSENMATIIANLRKAGKTISHRVILSADEVHALASLRLVKNSGIGTVGRALTLDDLDKVFFLFLFIYLFTTFIY